MSDRRAYTVRWCASEIAGNDVAEHAWKNCRAERPAHRGCGRCSWARRASSTTSHCRACCTWHSCAARMRTPRSGRSITAAALAVPGVHAVWPLDDLRPHLTSTLIRTALPSPSFRESRHRPVLADGEALYVGEPVAVVVADDRYIAEDAAALVMVDYEPLAGAGDCRRCARSRSSPVFHSEARKQHRRRIQDGFRRRGGGIRAAPPHTFKRHLRDASRRRAVDRVPRRVSARLDPIEDRLTLWSSTQTPHAAKKLLCELLGRDDDQRSRRDARGRRRLRAQARVLQRGGRGGARRACSCDGR